MYIPRGLCDIIFEPFETGTKQVSTHENFAMTAGFFWSTALGSASAQDVAAGKSSFAKCMACHAIGEGAKNKVGPELNGLNGRKSGTVAGYSYSEANKNSGLTWNEATFKDYIKDPKAKIPGTKMAFAGIKKRNRGQRPLGLPRAVRCRRESEVRGAVIPGAFSTSSLTLKMRTRNPAPLTGVMDSRLCHLRPLTRTSVRTRNDKL